MSEPVSNRSSARPRLWIVVLTYNGLADTRKCLGTLQAAIRPGVVPLLVDNGSTDDTKQAVEQEFPWCQILRLDPNAGPAGGNNRGIEHALAQGAEWILLLNNDTTVRPELCERLLDAAVALPDYAVLGPIINFMTEPELVMTDAVIFNGPRYHGFFERREVPPTQRTPPTAVETDVVNGCCMMIRADVFRTIGLFDENIFIYHDETDFCLRAWEAGFRCGVIDHQLIWHKGSSTFKDTGKRMARYYDSRNLYYVLRKHQGAKRHGRSWRSTAMMYVRYNYYRYCVEREAGFTVSADGVLEGVCDGLARRTGRHAERRRRMLPVLRMLFEALRHRPGRRAVGETA